MKKTGLGRGFDSLIPQHFDASILVDETERLQKLPIASIQANPEQPRKHFDAGALQELASSIKRYGVLQPIVVLPAVQGMYVIVAGERRYRAAKLAGLKTVPALVRSSEELERLEIALVENVQRVDLSPLEQAASIYQLHQQFNVDYDVIAARLGKAATTISNIIRLLHLPQVAQTALQSGKISEGHARAILALKDDKQQAALLKLIIEKNWTVRQAEQYVTAHKSGETAPAKAKARVTTTTPETKRLTKRLGTAVSIRRTAKGGKLEISFSSDKEFERIVGLLSHDK